MKCFQKLLITSYEDHVTNEDVCRKNQAATGKKQPTPDLDQEMETEVVPPCFKVFWLSKDNSTGHSEKEKKKTVDRISGKTVLKSGQSGLC